MKIRKSKTRMANRVKNKAANRAYKMKKKKMKYQYNTSLQKMKGKTARHNVGWAAATAINERQATAQENIAKANANKTFRFGADIIDRKDNDIQPNEQVLDWLK